MLVLLASHSNPSHPVQGPSECTYTKKEILCDWKSLENLVPDCPDCRSTAVTAHGQTICTCVGCAHICTSYDWWRSMQLIRAAFDVCHLTQVSKPLQAAQSLSRVHYRRIFRASLFLNSKPSLKDVRGSLGLKLTRLMATVSVYIFQE